MSDRWIAQFVKRFAEMREHVAGEQRFLAGALLKDRNLGGASADPRSDTTRVVDRQFAPDQSGADAGQNIAHSAARHSGIAGRVVADRFPTLADDCATSF